MLSLYKLKKSLALLLCSGCLLTVSLPAEATTNYEANIVIDNNPLTIPADDQPAIVVNGRTYVPLRVISENLGTRVEWNSQTKQVIISTANNSSGIIPDRSGVKQKEVQIVVDGKVLDVPEDYGQPFITAMNRTVVPLRAVGEALGCEVNWQKEGRIVDIKSRTLTSTPKPPEEISEEKPTIPIQNSGLLQELAQYRTNLKLLDKTVINSAELLNLSESSFSAEQMEQFKTYNNLLSKYKQQISLPDGTVLNTADITILGPAIASADQLRAWLAAETPRLRTKMEQQYKREFYPIPDLADLYIKIGAEYGIRGDLAFIQAAKETHYWQFTGDVQPWQNNYCGLWATGAPCTGQESFNGADTSLVRFEPGVHGAIFASQEVGVEAHIQHLYAYATKNPLPTGKVLVDPRYSLVSRGIAPTWLGLNARWAVPGTTYGQSIIQDYWLAALYIR